MTVKCVGCWESGWNTPIKEYDLWHYPMREYQVDEFIMTPVSGIVAQQITEAADVQAVIDANPTLTLVYVDEGSGDELGPFVHPANCLYIFGKASYSPWVAHGSPANSSVKIVTPADLGLLWGHEAACLVLQDRFNKA